MSAEALLQDLKNGKITPEEAVKRFEIPAAHIGEIPIDNLKVEVMPSGFDTFDDYMVLKRGEPELIILGARPSMGKSALMCQLAYNVAARGNVLIYSLEMDKKAIKLRLMASEAGRSVSSFQRGMVSDELLKKTNQDISSRSLYIDDRARLGIGDIRNSAYLFSRHMPVDLVVVDYLQLIKTAEKGTRDAEIGNITAELKALAKDVKCPVIVGSQLNRACETRGRDSGDYRPQLSDLRESGNIEQDADQVLFLSRQVVYDGQRAGEADISIAKNRNGKTGTFIMKFSQEQTRFIDMGTGI